MNCRPLPYQGSALPLSYVGDGLPDSVTFVAHSICSNMTQPSPRWPAMSEPKGRVEWSGRRDSDPRPSTWKADALPTELLPHQNLQERVSVSCKFWCVLSERSESKAPSPLKHSYLAPPGVSCKFWCVLSERSESKDPSSTQALLPGIARRLLQILVRPP